MGPDICFGALIAGRAFLLVRSDIPLDSDMMEYLGRFVED
jgi:hypothetical protein